MYVDCIKFCVIALFTEKEMTSDDNCMCGQCVDQLHSCADQGDVDGILTALKGKGTTDAIFVVRQIQNNFRVKGKKLHFGFVDLEKTFNKVLREVIRWAMHKLCVEEWLVLAVMYTGAKTVVRMVTINVLS